MSRFQFQVRPNTLNVNPADFEKRNAEINDFCDAAQVEPTSFKELYFNLLDFARFNAKNKDTSPDTSEEIKVLQTEITLKSDEIKALQERIAELENTNAALEAINQEHFSKDLARAEAEYNVLKVPATEEQIKVLEGIAQNRLDKNYEDELLSPAEIAKQMIFRESYLYNHWGVYFTGL